MSKFYKYSRKSDLLIRWSFHFIFFILGGFMITVPYLSISAPIWVPDLSSKIGQVLLSATFISLALSWANDRYILGFVRDSIEPIVDEFMKPSVEFILRNTIREYKWECYVSRSQEFDGYLKQNVTMSFISPRVGDRIVAVSAVSLTAALLSEYYDDENCIFRWKIDSDDPNLDPMREEVFLVRSIKINGVSIKLKKSKVKIKEEFGCVYIASVPKNIRDQECYIEIEASMLKPLGNIDHVHIRSSLFRDCIDAEARVYIEESLGVAKIAPNISETTPLIRRGDIDVGCRSGDPTKDHYMKFQYPLKHGSTFNFEVHLN